MTTFLQADSRLRIGAVTYLNSKPLIEYLPKCFPEAVIRDDYPSRLADDLAAGQLDVALIPSIEYFRGRNYEIVSDACVAARGPVLSVKLYSRVPWSDIRTLGLDEGSRTSAALVRDPSSSPRVRTSLQGTREYNFTLRTGPRAATQASDTIS